MTWQLTPRPAARHLAARRGDLGSVMTVVLRPAPGADTPQVRHAGCHCEAPRGAARWARPARTPAMTYAAELAHLAAPRAAARPSPPEDVAAGQGKARARR